MMYRPVDSYGCGIDGKERERDVLSLSGGCEFPLGRLLVMALCHV